MKKIILLSSTILICFICQGKSELVAGEVFDRGTCCTKGVDCLALVGESQKPNPDIQRFMMSYTDAHGLSLMLNETDLKAYIKKLISGKYFIVSKEIHLQDELCTKLGAPRGATVPEGRYMITMAAGGAMTITISKLGSIFPGKTVPTEKPASTPVTPTLNKK